MSKDKMHFRVRPGLALPLRRSPIRFAITMGNGLTSNTWGVRIASAGDAYIYCRDNFTETKISLHKSGKQHIAFTEGSGYEMTSGSRFWNQWWEPPQQNPAVPTLKLVFPSWGICLNEDERNKARSLWKRNQILIEGDDDFLTVVSFIILDDGVTLQKRGGPPSYPIAVLPLRPGKRLFVVAGKEPEGDFRLKVESVLNKIDVSQLPQTRVLERVLSVCLTGDDPLGFAYMVVVPVKVEQIGAPDPPVQ